MAARWPCAMDLTIARLSQSIQLTTWLVCFADAAAQRDKRHTPLPVASTMLREEAVAQRTPKDIQAQLSALALRRAEEVRAREQAVAEDSSADDDASDDDIVPQVQQKQKPVRPPPLYAEKDRRSRRDGVRRGVEGGFWTPHLHAAPALPRLLVSLNAKVAWCGRGWSCCRRRQDGGGGLMRRRGSRCHLPGRRRRRRG